MRKWRKWIGILLAVALLCQIHIPSMAAYSAPKDMDLMLAVLSEIGVITLDEEQGFASEGTVTRGKFCEYVGKMLGATPSFSMQYYNDVPREHDCAGYINTMADMGIVSLNEARIFEPDRPIRYAEACKMLLCAMGYGDYAAMQGEQMSNWVTGASEAGISTSVKNTDAITAGEAVEMIFKAMNEPIMVKQVGDGSMAVDKGSNLFAVYHHIYFDKGTVGAAYGAHLERYAMPQEGEAVINGTQFKTTIDLSGFLGTYVEYVYRWDKSEGEGTVFYARRLSDADVMTISSDLVEGFDERAYSLSYMQNKDADRAKKQTLDKNYQIVYNGVPYSGTVSSAIAGFLDGTRRGTVTLTDSDRNGKYDVVIIKNYEIFPQATLDTNNQKIYGGFEKETISYEDADIVRLFETDGTQKELMALSDAVLNVARSQDGKVIEIVVSRDSETFTVKSLRAEDGEAVAEDGTLYTFDKRVMEEYAPNWTAQATVTAYFDMFGYVVRIEPNHDDGYVVGYLLKGENYKESSRDVGARIKVYTRSGSIEQYNFADKVKIDGVSYTMKKQVAGAMNAIPNASSSTKDGEIVYRVAPQIIRYKLNESNQIVALDTTNLTDVEDKDNSLTIRHERASMLNANRVGLDTYWSTSRTALFTIPSLNSNGEIYKNGQWTEPEAKDFSTSVSLTFDNTYTVNTYNYSDDDYYVDIMIVVRNVTTSTPDVLLYTGSGQVWDEEEGSVLATVECMMGGSNTAFKLNPGVEETLTTQDFQYGDLFYVSMDSTGQYATSVKKIFDADTMTYQNSGNPYWYYGDYSPYSNWSYRTGENNRNNLSKMYVLKKRDSAVFGSYEASELASGDYEEIMNLGSVPVTIVYKDRGIVEKGSFNSILSYEEAGDNASLILVEHRLQSAISVIIYQ